MVTFKFNRDQLIRLETALDMLIAAKQGDGFNSDAAMEKSMLRAISAALDSPCFPHPAVSVLAMAAAQRCREAFQADEVSRQMTLDAGGPLI